MYVVFESGIVPIKGQMPDVKYRYLFGSLYNPDYTTHSDFALKFYDLDEAKKAADTLGMEVGMLVTKIEKVY